MNKLLILALACSLIVSCSDSSQREEAERLQRKEAALARAQEESNRQKEESTQVDSDSSDNQDDTSEAAAEEQTTPATPEQPQYQEVSTDYYTFITASGTASAITCESYDVEPCGVKLDNCSDKNSYRCVQNLKITTKITKELVTE